MTEERIDGEEKDLGARAPARSNTSSADAETETLPNSVSGDASRGDVEIRFDPPDACNVSAIDEVVARDSRVHLERMDKGQWSLIIESKTQRACFMINGKDTARSPVTTQIFWIDQIGSGNPATPERGLERAGALSAEDKNITLPDTPAPSRLCGHCDQPESLHHAFQAAPTTSAVESTTGRGTDAGVSQDAEEPQAIAEADRRGAPLASDRLAGLGDGADGCPFPDTTAEIARLTEAHESALRHIARLEAIIDPPAPSGAVARDKADQAIARILAGQPDRYSCLAFISSDDDGYCVTCGFAERCHEERAEVIQILDAFESAIRAQQAEPTPSKPDYEVLVAQIEWSGETEHVHGCCPLCFRFPVEGHEASCLFAIFQRQRAAVALPPDQLVGCASVPVSEASPLTPERSAEKEHSQFCSAVEQQKEQK